MFERVVDVVARRMDRLGAGQPPQEPKLFEVPDVGEVPDERGHERRVLCAKLVVGERLEQPERALARGVELGGDPLLEMGALEGGARHRAQV